jgi:hypothetical protein
MTGMESLLEEITAEVYDEKEAAVLEWRIETLMRAGFDAEGSFDLAFNKDVDLHSAVRLVERGCPPATAVRILL